MVDDARRDAPPEMRHFKPLLGIVTALGLAVRVAQVAANKNPSHLNGDEFYYYWQAHSLARGHWFVQPFQFNYLQISTPSADHPPGFVTFLAVLQRLHLDSPLIDRFVMAALGTLTVVLLALVVKQLIGERAAIIAGFIAAIYPNLWVNDGRLMSESMYVFCFAASLLAFYRFRLTRSWSAFVVMVVSLTIAATARRLLSNPAGLALIRESLVGVVERGDAGFFSA